MSRSVLNPVDLRIEDRLKSHEFAVSYVKELKEANAFISAVQNNRIAQLEAIVARQHDMLDKIASEAGFGAGETYTWIEIVHRLRQQGRNA